MKADTSMYFFKCMEKLFGRAPLRKIDLNDDVAIIEMTDKQGNEWFITMKENQK